VSRRPARARSRRSDAPRGAAGRRSRTADPLWYKDAIVYQIRLGAFQDSDGDGIGDFKGLTERLDYVADLGVTAIWLLPFYPSPRRDDGYDIADYTDVHHDAGTLDDFKIFLEQAHRRDLRVITELVINHTSDQHPWFQRARRSPKGSRWRDFYVWSDDPERYSEARIIFQDFEPSNWSWDPVAKAYYWHRFYHHQPDLNFDSQDVRRAVKKFFDFWLSMGVDGMRLDAIPYLYEREGTNCENLPETHEVLKELRRHLDSRFDDRMFLAEANQWPEDAVAYFGDGDECHMSFHFPVMPRLFMALHMEDRYPIIDILNQTPEIPETCQWALFLRNHDELTLEMVTDEERDYMYGVYAHDARARINLGIRRRLLPLLGNDRRRIELMNALLFSLPGTPVLYYGDEIGMGDNIYLGDRNGVRTPMQWSADRNAGFSRANPQQLYLPVIIDPEYHYEAINVEAQQQNSHSLLHWMKGLIGLRKRYRAFSRGTIEFLHPANRKVLAFLREWEDERILVLANLSRFAEYVELDMSRDSGTTPVELWSGHAFPRIGELPYLLTLGPHSFYWFRLEQAEALELGARPPGEGEAPILELDGSWRRVFEGDAREVLEASLPRYLPGRRWFGGKAQAITGVALTDVVPLQGGGEAPVLATIRVEQGASSASYVLPLAFATGERAEALRRDHSRAVVAELHIDGGKAEEEGVLFDALEDEEGAQLLLRTVELGRRRQGERGTLAPSRSRRFRGLRGPREETLHATVVRAEQSNTSVIYGRRLILKLYRRLGEGINPELEIGRHLTDRARFPNTPAVAGALEYRVGRREPATVAVLQEYVANEGDAWRYTLDHVEQFLGRALARLDEEPPAIGTGILGLLDDVPPVAHDLMGVYLENARLLGHRTAELHEALADAGDDDAFAPEPFSTLYQRSLYQSLRNLTTRSFDRLRAQHARLSGETRRIAAELADREDEVLDACRAVVGARLGGRRIRCHGDYHLGQVLYTGSDFVIIDFEGEPARSLSERRLKRSPLRDVAGMLRSFDYAAHHALLTPDRDAHIRDEDASALGPWARCWRQWASSSFLREYLPPIRAAGLVPADDDQLERLLRILLLDKSIYELGYELDNRPDWAGIPMRGILELLDGR
jgi:maltose alpha-D-glucosyltransferase/alpha-amylase